MAAPVISAIVAVQVGTSIQVSWNTDQLADSTLEWGATDPRGTFTQLDLAFSQFAAPQVLNHVETTPGLAPFNTYALRVRSSNAANEEAVSAVFSLATFVPAPAVVATTNVVLKTQPKKGGKSRYFLSIRALSNATGGPPIRTWGAQVFWGTSPTSMPNSSAIYTVNTPNTQSFADFVDMDFGSDVDSTKDVYFSVQFTGALNSGLQQTFVEQAQQDPSDTRFYSREDGIEIHWDKVLNPPSYLVKHAPSLQAETKKILAHPPQPLFTVRTQSSPEQNGLFQILMKDGYITIPGLIENNPKRMYLGGVTHVAFEWDEENIELFINGSSAVRLASKFSFKEFLGSALTTEIRVGADFLGNFSEAFVGSLRISNKKRSPTEFNYGVLSEDPFQFLSPAAPLATDANTIALYQLAANPLDTAGAPGGPYNASWVGAPVYGGPPFGLTGIIFPAAGKFRTPAANAYLNLPNAVLSDVINGTPDLRTGTIDFWAIWLPDTTDPLPAPTTTPCTLR